MRRRIDLEIEIDNLDRLSRTELRARWKQELGDQPPASLGRDDFGARHRKMAPPQGFC